MTENRAARVSLIMIVRNEAHQLGECLGSVASLFDEIVIVDTGSTDATREIAARFSANVFDFPWCDDFSAARNEALRRSQGEWVFWLDADDRLSDENVDRLRLLLAGLDTAPRVYFMNTACSAQYACEGVSLITHPRLFRRHDDLRWQGRVHEQIRPEPRTLGHELVWSDVQIQHVGYEDATVKQRKLNRDVRLLRMDYAVDPDNASTLLHLGMAYFHLGRFDQAREFLQRLLATSQAPGEHWRQVYCALATIAMREGDMNDALAIIDRGLAQFPDGQYLSYLRADCLYELDRFGEAKATLVQLISGQSRHQYFGGMPGDIREKLAPRKLADVLRLERNFEAAEPILKSLVSRFPTDTHSWHMLGRLYLDWRQQEKLLAVIERLRSCPQGEIFAALLLAMWQFTQNELAAAGQTIERLIGQAPQMPMPRLLRAEWLNQTGAAIPQRMQAYRDILRLMPGHLDARRTLQSLELAHSQELALSQGGSSSVVLGAGLPQSVAGI